jgi:type II secretory pathway pseudopilin PulG
MTARSARHRAQAGTTLVELVVSVMIIGLVLVMLVGAFSTGLLNTTLEKRNTAVEAVVQYELEKVGAASFATAAYSECFAVDTSAAPSPASGLQGSCPSGSNLRADVTRAAVQGQVGVQQWTVSVRTWPAGATVGTPVSVYKVNR